MIRTLKINAKITSKTITKKIYCFVSSNTKNGFWIQKIKLRKKPKPEKKQYMKKFIFFKLLLLVSTKKQINGKNIKPKGKKK